MVCFGALVRCFSLQNGHVWILLPGEALSGEKILESTAGVWRVESNAPPA